MNRGNRKAALFLKPVDRRRFLGLVSEWPERFQIEVHAFVLMDNQYHLLVRLGPGGLSRAVQWLQLSYGVRFNWENHLTGHVFQGRFKAVHIQKDEDVAAVARYLHLNPVGVDGLGLGKAEQRRARVTGVEDPGRDLVRRRLEALDAYPWSSWRVYGGNESAPAWLETGFLDRANGGRTRSERMKALREYTEAPVRQAHVDSPWDRVVGSAVLGEENYAKRLLSGKRVNREEQTGVRKLGKAKPLTWEKLVKLSEGRLGKRWEECVDRYGDWTRDAVMYVAVIWGGHSLASVQREVEGLKYQAAAQGVKRIRERLKTDEECREFVNWLRKQLSTV